MQRVDFENETAISVPRLSTNSIVQVYDSKSQAFTPNRLEQLTDTIEIEFLVPESGHLLIFSVGEL